MTQQEQAQAIYTEYLNTPKRNILDVYGRPSADKLRAEQIILNYMQAQDGTGYKILTHNISQFTCAYIIKDKNQLVYYTRDYIRVIDLENFKIISKKYNV